MLRWTGLPRHLLVLGAAFVAEDGGTRHPLRVAGLLRALTVQLTYRTLLGQVYVLPGRAVLLWSLVHAPPAARAARTRLALRRVAAAAVAAVVGAVAAVASFGAVLVPADLLLQACGYTGRDALLTVLGLGALSAGLTAHGAVSAYRANRDWATQMTALPDTATWRVDLLGAVRKGHGDGGSVLDGFLRRADAEGAQVYLVTSPRHHDFYRRHGLRTRAEFSNGMLLMHRRLVSPVPARARR